MTQEEGMVAEQKLLTALFGKESNKQKIQRAEFYLHRAILMLNEKRVTKSIALDVTRCIRDANEILRQLQDSK